MYLNDSILDVVPINGQGFSVGVEIPFVNGEKLETATVFGIEQAIYTFYSKLDGTLGFKPGTSTGILA